jgi:hypothetical protein
LSVYSQIMMHKLPMNNRDAGIAATDSAIAWRRVNQRR